MFRIVTVSANRLQGRYHGGSSRLYRTLRYYSKAQQQSELCPPPPPKTPPTGTTLTIGALALACGGIIGYAKYDPDFRCVLTDYVPFTDDVIKFVFQEEKPYSAYLYSGYTSLKKSLVGDDDQKIKRKVIEEPKKDYLPPPPIIPGVAKEIKEPEQVYSEIRLETKHEGTSEPAVEIVDPKLPIELAETHPKNIGEIETAATEAAKNAVLAYEAAVFALKNYASDVEVVVEESVERLDPQIWNSLREKSKAKDEAIANAERDAQQATQVYRKLHELLSKTDFDLPQGVKEQALKNINEVGKDLANAKKELEEEKKKSNVTEKYWRKVQDARHHFSEELEILFPHMDLSQKKINISEGDLDMFALHAMAKVLYYQKELQKLETVASERLKYAVESARRGGLEVLTTEQVCNEVEREKRALEEDYQKKCLKLRNENETELRRQLKLQSEAFSDHLTDAVKLKELEVEKKLSRTFDEKLTDERCRFKEQVAAMVGRLRGFDRAMKARNEQDKSAHQAQVLWAACQALYRAVKAGCPGIPWGDQLRPLDPEIRAVKQAAVESDELVMAVLKGIPSAAKNRGVFPEDALRERFIKVEKMARRLSLVPENGARLHIYLLSYLQSFLLLKAANPIPQSELNDDETDFTKLSTNDILQRARYWIDRGDFSQTLKYMNLLRGAPRSVARQWMEETRILLETQQAANTLMAHATASGLVYL